ncbi:MAG: PAS domain S-box protein [Opitutaceae bacterium]|nr:PAS domain S-box protein [Opitutaceae bacterium]
MCDNPSHAQPPSEPPTAPCPGAGNPDEALFAMAYDQLAHPAGIVDRTGVLKHANQAACSLIGYPVEALVGRTFWKTPWWAHAEAEQAKLREAVTRAVRGEVVHFETTHRLADGSLRPFDFTLRPILEANGHIIALGAEAWDIAERLQSIEQLRQMANEHRTILNTISSGICLLRNRRLQWANTAYFTMFGFSPGEMIGVDVSCCYADPADYERVGREGYECLARGEVYTTDARVVRKSGAPFWCTIVGQALDPQHLEAGAIWVLRDITDRRQADLDLLASQERLEAAQEQARIGSWELLPESGTGSWSKQMFRLFGLEPGSQPPSFAEFFGLIHPDDRARLEAAHAQVLTTGVPKSLEYRSHPARGPLRHFSAKIKLRPEGPGQPLALTGTLQDISERVRAETAARETQERLALAMQGSELGIWDWEIGSGQVEFDEGWDRVLGYERSDPARPRTWDALIPPSDLPRLRTALAEHAAACSPFFEVELRMHHKDGSWLWTLSRGKVMERDASGAPLRAAGTLIDITQRRQREEALHSSERKLAEIFRASPEMIVVSRLDDGLMIEVNDAFTRILGYSHEETIGHTSLEIGLWPTPEARAAVVQEARLHGSVRNRETLMCRKDRSTIQVELSVSPMLIDGQKCMIWLLTDVTDRKRAEAAMRESTQRFERLVQNSNDLIAVLDAEGTMRSLIGPVQSILGYEPSDLIGQNGFGLIHPDDVPRTRQVFAAAAAEPGSTQRAEYRFPHKRDGHWVWMEAVGTNWLHDPGIAGFVLNIREITERKNAEEERVKLQEQLQQAMKMETVGRLAGGVAHDFNNLLTVIAGNVELARADLSPDGPLAQQLAEIARAAESAATLTRQLLAFSRRQVIEPKVLDLNELIGNLRKMLQRLIGEDIALELTQGAELGAVKVDPGQFEQVVVNLSVNARDAMPEGGRLVITTSNVELDATYCQQHQEATPGNYVMLAVSDTGHGMPPEVRRRLFEPFFTTKPQGRGTGLGLAMIFGVVKQAGGLIEVYSEVGHGTTFKVYLPRIEQPVEKLARTPVRDELPRGTETILLVEDDDSVRGLSLSILKRHGYKVLAAPNGGEAFLLAEKRTEPIDLLLTDVVMPGMSGRELAERLQPLHPETAVLFTSGYTEDMVVLRGVMEENLHFIGKPYTIPAIVRKVRQVLDARPPRV